MAEDLQHLLDHIKKKGIDEATQAAERIVATAKGKADELMSKAHRDAETLMRNARVEADAFQKRAAESIRQSARDIIRSVDKAIMQKVADLFREEIARVLDDDTLQTILAEAISRFISQDDETESQALLPAEQIERLRGHLLGKLKSALDERGVSLAPGDHLASGFKLRSENGRVEYDFSDDAITTAMSNLLRPSLAELLAPREAE